MEKDIVIGQRWISDTELQMGIGTVLAADHRTVTVIFLASGETRVYAKQTAPLTRVRFSPGDTITSHEGWRLKVDTVTEEDGLLNYQGIREDGEAAELAEGQLDNFIQLNQPAERLFSGQIDQNKWFELRYQTYQQENRLGHSDLYGFAGTRTSLIPHQLFIAHEVANRYAPRVLLADEVGLGKTIEAGLIVHQQLLTERAQRVLIIVPETLLHQWLIEMLRRFNLHFSIFDEERCLSLEEENPEQSPFLAEQLVLCSLGFLSSHPRRVEQAAQAKWDLLVVDEAHHLQWSPQKPSLEYQLIDTLAKETPGVILLTATPEQLGKAGHFARLRLLDPDRFPDLYAFIAEEKSYQPVAEAIDELMNKGSLSEQSYQVLSEALAESDNRHLLDVLNKLDVDEHESLSARKQLMDHLLDRHGTGRILFRNTRNAVKGFPQRKVNAYPLPLPKEYSQCFLENSASNISDPQLLLSPELLFKNYSAAEHTKWAQVDPRVLWLEKLLKELKPEKVLVITANAATAMEIMEIFRLRSGIHAAVFHENMNIIERDRAAAFFADREIGSQVLICSEIGSEGRNFQFAHHLVLFDLPLNPDLLEQRIGRLDRIGQTQTINIHIPYLENSAQETMYHWYQEGLDAFTHTCPAGHDVFTQVKAELVESLHWQQAITINKAELISKSRNLHNELNQLLQAGRDRLLEYNSCRPDAAATLKENAQQDDIKHNPFSYLNKLFDCFGVEVEDHSENCFILRPVSQQQTQPISGLPDEGMTVTFDRDTALVFEDVHYLSWEHPLVRETMDLVLSQEQGNTALTSINIQDKRFPPGTLLLECLFVLSASAAPELKIERYLPPSTLRILVDQSGSDCSDRLSHDAINRLSVAVTQDISRHVIRNQEAVIRKLLGVADQLASRQAPEILAVATAQGKEVLFEELNRLKELSEFNANIRADEIAFFETQWIQLNDCLESVAPRLDGLRVIVTT